MEAAKEHYFTHSHFKFPGLELSMWKQSTAIDAPRMLTYRVPSGHQFTFSINANGMTLVALHKEETEADRRAKEAEAIMQEMLSLFDAAKPHPRIIKLRERVKAHMGIKE